MTFRRSATAWLLIKHSMTGNVNGNSHGTGWDVLASLPDSLRDPAVGPDQFRRDLKTHMFEWHCVSFSALAVFSRNALYKSTFYLLTYLLLRQLLAHFYSGGKSEKWWTQASWRGNVGSCRIPVLSPINLDSATAFVPLLWAQRQYISGLHNAAP